MNRWNALDILLAVILLFGLPMRALLRSSSTPSAPIDKPKIYRKSVAIIASCLMILFADWTLNSRGFGQLGLAAPNTHAAMAGCVFAVLVASIAFLVPISKSQQHDTSRADDYPDTILPQSHNELRSFIIFTIIAGVGWEVLYRGFLLFWLSPIIGLMPAVAASSIAYGLSHRGKTKSQTIGSLVSALLFTTGYAATGSLWWLIILHISLPIATMQAILRREQTVVPNVSG